MFGHIFSLSFLLYFHIFIFITIGYRFKCLNFHETNCDCDTDEELIDCNSRQWTKFPKIDNRLRGYAVLALAFNDISGPLPNETEVLRQLPDLELIDLRGNDRLDCDEILSKFDRINVHSHCIEKELIKEQLASTTTTTTTTTRPTTTATTTKPSIPSSKGKKIKITTPAIQVRPVRPTYNIIIGKLRKTTIAVAPQPCISLWCRVDHHVTNAYSKVYVNVHRVWVRMKNEFRAQHANFQRQLYNIWP